MTNDEKTKKVLMVEDVLGRMATELEAIQSIDPARRTPKDRWDELRLKQAIKLFKKRGFIRQGPSEQPRAALEVGESVELRFEKPGEAIIAYMTVDRVKADGRVFGRTDGQAFREGEMVLIKTIAYGIYRSLRDGALALRPLRADEVEPWKAGAFVKGFVVFRSEEVQIEELPPVDGVLKPGGLSASQLARRIRKANRKQGQLERRMKRAAAQAPAGSIGEALHSGGY